MYTPQRSTVQHERPFNINSMCWQERLPSLLLQSEACCWSAQVFGHCLGGMMQAVHVTGQGQPVGLG